MKQTQTQTMYGTVIGNGRYDLTRDQIIAMVRDCPIFTDPDLVAAVDTDGTQYTGRDLCDMAGVELQN